jgi:predicted lipoprotein with Yx(FWY)xxD motif
MKSLKFVWVSLAVLSLVAVLAATALAAPVMTLQSANNASLGNILTDDKGMTLYIFKSDKPGVSNCTGPCATNWPPLTVADEDAKPALAEGLSGKIAVIDRPDGTYQVTFNDWPLYYFKMDAKPGDATGNGKGGVWEVIKIGQPASAPAASSSGW